MSFFDKLWRSLQRQFLRKLYFYSLIWPKVIFTLYFPFTITSAEMNYIGFDRAFQVQRSAIITKYILKFWGKLVPSYVHWSAPFVKCGLFRLWRWDPAMGESNAHQTAQYLHILSSPFLLYRHSGILIIHRLFELNCGKIESDPKSERINKLNIWSLAIWLHCCN